MAFHLPRCPKNTQNFKNRKIQSKFPSFPFLCVYKFLWTRPYVFLAYRFISKWQVSAFHSLLPYVTRVVATSSREGNPPIILLVCFWTLSNWQPALTQLATDLTRGAQIPGIKSSGRLNFAGWHLIFLCSLYGTCFMSTFWRLEILDGFWIFGEFVAPWP
jgi:hypothetical protein